MRYYIDAKNGVLARSSASTSSEIVGVGIPWGYVVAGASVSAPSGWYAVQWAGRNAFIPATYAHAVDDGTPLTDNKYNYGPSGSASSTSSSGGSIFDKAKEMLTKVINGGSSSGSSGGSGSANSQTEINSDGTVTPIDNGTESTSNVLTIGIVIATIGVALNVMRIIKK